MFKRLLLSLVLLAVTGLAAAQTPPTGGGKWVEGKNYFRIDTPQPTSTPGKIEVVEVLSYACPVCWRFLPYANKIAKMLPADAQIVYMPASFIPQEDWPLFQRAYYTAKALGVEEKTHDAMFKAIHQTGELAVADPATGRLKSPLPDLNDVAKFYAKYGIKPADFIATANSFAVNTKMKRADALVKAYGVEGTPTMVVDGKWRYDVGSAGGVDQVVELTKYLVDLDRTAGAAKP
ncbi:MAG: thiol:disulfide interchange protein DsbA/DsbL [Rhodanobacteraceae bacterium]